MTEINEYRYRERWRGKIDALTESINFRTHTHITAELFIEDGGDGDVDNDE